MNTIQKTLVGLLLAGAAGSAWPLAVSDVDLHSHLNQPLDARVRLLSASQDELDTLVVTVTGTDASGSSFITLRHEIAQDDQGLYIHVTSEAAIREPIVTLQMELSWSKGRLAREYSLIIDPQ